MGEINKPTKRTFWNVKDSQGNVIGEGFTDIDQVTTTGQPTINFSESAVGIYPALPSTEGTPLVRGEIYEYNGGMVQVVQDHNRTIFPPEDTPALFSVYRPNTEGMFWIAGEAVDKGDIRLEGLANYQCIQAHTTQVGWEPSVTPTLWKVVQEDFAPWVQPTGAQDAYELGATVSHNGANWISTVAANVWEPGVFGWDEVV